MPLGARLPGPLDRAALIQSVRDVVARHGALRTRFTSATARAFSRWSIRLLSSRSALHDLRSAADPDG